MESGTRYSLFVCDTNGSVLPGRALPAAPGRLGLGGRVADDVDLRWLVQPSLAQFAYFERAHALVEAASDAELAELVQEYAACMAMGLGRHAINERSPASVAGASTRRPRLAVEMVWRTHMLHPMDYAADCATLREGRAAVVDCDPTGRWPAINLVAAMRRQQASPPPIRLPPPPRTLPAPVCLAANGSTGDQSRVRSR